MAWSVSGFLNCPVKEGVGLCDNCLQVLQADHWHEQGPGTGLCHGYGAYPFHAIGVWGFCSQRCAEQLLSALSAADIAQRVYA